ncbi:MAG: tryptophanase [Actinomycetota bacterium]|nr:tryptophanase [Actinomycetota bacterium]
MEFETIIEPFKIKSVEPLPITTPEERLEALKREHWNIFGLKSQEVTIDLLTDSGTGSMSSEQWASLMRGDESYAGSQSWQRFEEVVKELTGYKHIIPTHQGRASERILASIMLQEGNIVPSNSHFDTTRANVEFTGSEALDLICKEGEDLLKPAPFKGNVDLEKLEETLSKEKGNIPYVLMTVTNNTGGGQPVSMENLKATREVCSKYGIPMFLDACRFAENSWFIHQREKGYESVEIREIAKEIFRLSDGCTISLKKDGFGNIGGFIGVNDDKIAAECKNMLILTEGFPTYGGLAGRDLDALAQGLKEITDKSYLEYRARSISYLADKATEYGIPVVQPAGGHALYLDAKTYLPHIPPHEYPGQAIVCEMYLLGGIRCAEIGTFAFGVHNEEGPDSPASNELVRLASPRRTYTQSHFDYVGEVLKALAEKKDTLSGYKITEQPEFLRHFTAKLEPI